MKTLLIIFLTLLTPLMSLAQKGSDKVAISNPNITLINNLLNKKIYNYNKLKNLTTIDGVSTTDKVGLMVGKVRTEKMIKSKKLGHIMGSAYDEIKDTINPNSKTLEVGENVIYSSEFIYKDFTYNQLVTLVYKTFMGSKPHKMLIASSYNEKDYEIFISTYITFKKNGSFYGSMVVSQ